MVICAVEDLMFASKLRSAASRGGIALRFVRGPEDPLEAVRAETPRLVILDLNADRLRPLDMVAALRGDGGLPGVRIVGFVSHVQADRVAAARAAGVDEVLARSAFVAGLPALVGSQP